MAVQMRPGYVNPFTAMSDRKPGTIPRTLNARPGGKQDRIAELQSRQQTLQNRMLLLKATGTDSAGAAAETQKAVAAELEEVTDELKRAEVNGAQDPDTVHGDARSVGWSSDRDRWVPERSGSQSPGLYRVRKDEAGGYRILFSPYSAG